MVCPQMVPHIYICILYNLSSMNKNLKDSSALEPPGHHYGPSLQGIHGSDAHDSLKWFPLCRHLSLSFVTTDKPAVNILALTSLCASQHYF